MIKTNVIHLHNADNCNVYAPIKAGVIAKYVGGNHKEQIALICDVTHADVRVIELDKDGSSMQMTKLHKIEPLSFQEQQMPEIMHLMKHLRGHLCVETETGREGTVYDLVFHAEDPAGLWHLYITWTNGGFSPKTGLEEVTFLDSKVCSFPRAH